jgi:hypothetical protein
MWQVLVRFVVVAFGFVCAALTGAITLFAIGGHWAAAEINRQMERSHPGQYDEFGFFGDVAGNILFALAVVPSLTLLPALGAIIAGEVMKIRSALYYIAAGGAAAAVMPLTMRPVGDEMVHAPAGQYLAIMATAGFAAGLVYWLIAGRRA